MMSKRFLRCLVTACLLLSTALAGCAGTAGNTGAPAPRASAPAAATQSAAPAASRAAAADGLSNAFTAVEKNPLNESIQYELWLAANAPDPTNAPASETADLQPYVDKYQSLVADRGIHYVEAVEMMGIEVETEYWVKGGKFRKYDGIDVYMFDGQHFYHYSPDDKKGTRSSADYAALDLDQLTKGMLSRLAASPYQRKDDKKFGAFDCAVYYTDMEMNLVGMKLKGSTLYVDKATGMLVNNVTGDAADKENSFSTFVKSLEVGGFGDEVFTVPADVTLEDYN